MFGLLTKRTQNARYKAYSNLGVLDKDPLVPVGPSEYVGTPLWPSGEPCFRILRRPPYTAIITDGLSNPFDKKLHKKKSKTGLGLEFIIETIGTHDEVDLIYGSKLSRSWLYHAIWSASAQAMEKENSLSLYNEFGLFTFAIQPSAELGDHVDSNGYVGLLAGIVADGIPNSIDLPNQEAALIPLTLIKPDEFEFVQSDKDGTFKLMKLLNERKHGHISDPNRSSVLAI